MKLIDVMRRMAADSQQAARAMADMYLGRGHIRRPGSTAPIYLVGGVLERQELDPGRYTYWCGTPGRVGTYRIDFVVS